MSVRVERDGKVEWVYFDQPVLLEHVLIQESQQMRNALTEIVVGHYMKWLEGDFRYRFAYVYWARLAKIDYSLSRNVSLAFSACAATVVSPVRLHCLKWRLAGGCQIPEDWRRL